LFTDDPQKAFKEMRAAKVASTGKEKFAFAEVKHMIDPPETKSKFVVFEILED
jgi:hypothetical protein